MPVIDARAFLARATFLENFSCGASNKMLARHRQAETPVPLFQAVNHPPAHPLPAHRLEACATQPASQRDPSFFPVVSRVRPRDLLGMTLVERPNDP